MKCVQSNITPLQKPGLYKATKNGQTIDVMFDQILVHISAGSGKVDGKCQIQGRTGSNILEEGGGADLEAKGNSEWV